MSQTSLSEQLTAHLKIEKKLEDKLDLSDCLFLVIDIQNEGTSRKSYLYDYFQGSVSADNDLITNIWNKIRLFKKFGAKIFGIRLVHDLSRMAEIDPLRLQNQIRKGLVDNIDGKLEPKIYRPNSFLSKINYGNSTFRLPQSMIFNKCCRDLTLEPEILKRIMKAKRKVIFLTGLDANVCVYESAVGLLEKLSSSYQIVIPVDMVSTRPEEYEDVALKFLTLQSFGIIFTNTSDFRFHG